MSIRGDLKEVEALISRLISIGGEFRAKDKWWAHLKNGEDYNKVWRIQDQAKKIKIEKIYCDGRDMELFMSEALESINFDFTRYPTLTSIIEKLTNTWISQDLETPLSEAIKAHEELGLNNWAFGQMCATFQEQIELAKVVKQTLEHLKESTLYKVENNLPVKTDNPTISISNITNSNIALNSNNAAQNINANEELFAKLIDAIKASEIQNKEPLVSAAEEMQLEAQSGSIFNSYKKFMALAADHMTVVSPFIPLLTALL
ncbi:hypothetical protein [Aquipseudomonas alcaligenes]|uniref:Uncharacterized protein n=1 Tax=Aquipseudomonas alcaligenes TaxID=43263 RepID=A0AB73I1U8_AQUAC|nr:hypothetical protein [Pseudomonas alcaligenes]MDH0144136.1 hypothetical protein [Pseudomonas alcaligenes]